MMSPFHYCLFTVVLVLPFSNCHQFGPDPWHNYEKTSHDQFGSDTTVPPDLKFTPHTLQNKMRPSNSVADWFYKRMLVIFLKGGEVKETNEAVEVSINLKLQKEHWNILNQYMTSPNALNENMYRRSVGYIEDSICKPTITEKIAKAWDKYIMEYISFYKMEFVSVVGMVIAIGSAFLIWRRLTSYQLKIFFAISIYIYEVFISYKEAEQKEYENFIAAVNRCNWFIWSSTCDVPAPDLLLFLKHMHPIKIAIRILTYVVSEPMLAISSTATVIVEGVTGGLWSPLKSVISGFLLLIINLTLIMLLVIILFNFIFNIPFNLSFFAGLISFGVKQRNRTFAPPVTTNSDNNSDTSVADKISGTNLNRLITILANSQKNHNNSKPSFSKIPSLKKSASAGRLADMSSHSGYSEIKPDLRIDFKPKVKKRFGLFRLGGGDA